MFRYKHEAEFSRALCSFLRKKGWFVQRIESGTTGRGVPDIYAVNPAHMPVWLELKRIHTYVRYGSTITVPWREGQQAWLTNITKLGQYAYTLACCDNLILRIPHDKTYPENRISLGLPGVKAYFMLPDLIT